MIQFIFENGTSGKETYVIVELRWTNSYNSSTSLLQSYTLTYNVHDKYAK